MDHARVAELQVLLEGVPLPATRGELLEYARHERAEPWQVDALRRLPDREYGWIDEAAEELLRVQPPRPHVVPDEPRATSGAPPGGDDYTNPRPESGRVPDLDSVA
ncbi:MAG TPA: DUF2795 domain-containing protein [Gaiellaceae bacterium]|nr:DUF2795 domain-containing protein [Gaiellaceae bacterium]